MSAWPQAEIADDTLGRVQKNGVLFRAITHFLDSALAGAPRS
jgi:hypothetical protein